MRFKRDYMSLLENVKESALGREKKISTIL